MAHRRAAGGRVLNAAARGPRARRRALAAAAQLALGLAACSWPMSSPAPPPDWRSRLAAAPAAPPSTAWPLPAPQLERLIASAEASIRRSEGAGAGVTGARRVTLHFPAIDRDIEFKWKVPSRAGDGWNNTPRKEIAAYAVQQWFLDPEDYVVPTIAMRCFPLADYAPVDSDPEPTLSDTRCVLGSLAVWLQDVQVPDRLYQPERFYREPTYARSLAHLNLLTYLIEHRDLRRGNVLASRDEAHRRVFSVDNGISFGGRLYNFFQRHWDRIVVPAVPSDAVARLRRVGPRELRALAVVAEMEVGPDGVLRSTEPGAPIDPERGARRRAGRFQLGLTEEEIEGVAARLAELLQRIDRGDPPLF